MSLSELLYDEDGCVNMHIERVLEKGDVAERRKSKFNCREVPKYKHWDNRAGTYLDEEEKRAPKYWKGQKQVRGPRMIRKQGDLIEAVRQIANGQAGPRDYTGRNATDADRLRIAYLWRKQGQQYNPSHVTGLNTDEIKAELGVVTDQMQPY